MASGSSTASLAAGDSLNFENQSASDYARQHVGNVYNNNTYQYTIRKRRSDETLRPDGRSQALLKAAAEGQTPRVSYLIRLGVDLDHSDDNGFTALHHAALSGFEDTVEVLLAAGCDVNAASLDLGTPLHLAASKGRENVVHRLLSYRADVNATSRLMASPLHCAGLGASYPVAAALIQSGADVRKRSVLMCYVLQELDAEYPEKGTLNECEPLHCAAEGGNLSLVQLLLDQGVPIDTNLRLWRSTRSGPKFVRKQ